MSRALAANSETVPASGPSAVLRVAAVPRKCRLFIRIKVFNNLPANDLGEMTRIRQIETELPERTDQLQIK